MGSWRWRHLLLIFLVSSAWLLGIVPPSSARPLRVSLFVTVRQEQRTNPYWHSFLAFMAAAAQDLGIELDPHLGFDWPTQSAELLRKIGKGPHRPDYLVITIHRGTGAILLKEAEMLKIPVFVVDSGLLKQDRKRYGGPRQHFKFWIGQMVMDHAKTGYDLAKVLADDALRIHPGEPVQMVAFGGPNGDQASERADGLRKAVAQRKDIHLLQLFNADWLFSRPQRLTPLILKRYPTISAIWAANDAMALGTLKPLQDHGRKPGTDVAVGGIDWTPQALDAIQSGKLNASFGGQFMYGGWVLVLLYDYYHGLDFRKEHLDWHPEMALITRKNVRRYRCVLDHSTYARIDFRKFSKVLNPKVRRYDFSVKAIVDQLRGES